MNKTDEIIGFVSKEFGWSGAVKSMLGVDGSDRLYYRIKNCSESMILMVYGNDKLENHYFSHIQNFLFSIGVNVPKIILAIAEKKWIFLEDLGNTSFYGAYPNWNKKEKIFFYKSVIDEVCKIYANGVKLYKENPFDTVDGFSFNLYKWEQNYFIDNYFSVYKKITPDLSVLNPHLDNMAQFLSKQENKLIHRDLQSKNIMIKDNSVYLIDFQGLRHGLPEYDLASLLKDPYVDIEEEIIEEVVNYYIYDKAQATDSKLFHHRFNLCSIQRLMQALGAYCYLGIVKNKTHFLKYIPYAERKLVNELRKIPELSPLSEMIEKGI